jgi:hypothetical protein
MIPLSNSPKTNIILLGWLHVFIKRGQYESKEGQSSGCSIMPIFEPFVNVIDYFESYKTLLFIK